MVSLARTIQAEGVPLAGSRALTSLSQLVHNSDAQSGVELTLSAPLANQISQVAGFRRDTATAIVLFEAGQFEAAEFIIEGLDISTAGASIVILQKHFGCSSTSSVAVAQDADHPYDTAFDRRRLNTELKSAAYQRNASMLDQNVVASAGSNATSDRIEKIETTDAVVMPGSNFLAMLLLLVSTVGAFGIWQTERTKKHKKRAHRYSLSFPIRVSQKGQGRPAQLIEISETGCKIQHQLGRINKRITLLVLGKLRKARIVWANDHYAGVKFKKPIEFEFLLEIMRAARNPGDLPLTIPNGRPSAGHDGVTAAFCEEDV